MPFDRSPGHQERNNGSEREVGKSPNTAKDSGGRKRDTRPMKVNVPRKNRDFVEQPEGENKDHDVVVDGHTECSLSK